MWTKIPKTVAVKLCHCVQAVVRPKDPYTQVSSPKLNLQCLMSASADIAFQQVCMFFSEKELFPDPECRPLLPYLPPLRTQQVLQAAQIRSAFYILMRA